MNSTKLNTALIVEDNSEEKKTVATPSQPITLEKIKIYDKYSGDFGKLNSNGSKTEKRKISKSDFNNISMILTKVHQVNQGLTSKEYERKIMNEVSNKTNSFKDIQLSI